MPELPEVEVVRRSIAPYLEGTTVLEVFDIGSRFALPSLSGRAIKRVFRHGKCLFFEFFENDALFVHLGMTGKFLLSETRISFPHQHLIFYLSSGVFLSFCDQRKFGKIKYLTRKEKENFLATLGIDPFSPAYTFERVGALLSGKRRIKDFLLDQHKIAGIGNIYASEILFRSGIHPERKLLTLTGTEKGNLFLAIPAVLDEAIRCQGTTIRDFAQANGEKGSFQDCLAVYGREGEPCLRCGTPIARKVIGSRSTYFCPHCQK
ncbi:MAG: bifunctional DNA-formamidopyrimidine glycosylase/DNA-(apurinic or apyrimidinic site) lyase [Candidatus Atribacteria bacterium]|nr:bifunctional DNA-formamidopyrimidine glycosylase/DNA-(apurinic or apyrimidinic site) lyase [Candidatus Atribacteria bacterium]